MSDSNDESIVRLKQGGTNPYGATFWSLEFDNRFNGKARGGVHFTVDIHSQKEGLWIAGQLISWVDLLQAKVHAEAIKPKRHDDVV